MNIFGQFILSLIFFWWVYLGILIIGIVVLCIAKHDDKLSKSIGGLLIIAPISCYVIGFLLFAFAR